MLALALNTSAYTAEIIRGAIQAVPAGEVEAARSCGMSGLLLRRRIVWPIALRQGLPVYGSEAILMIKATLKIDAAERSCNLWLLAAFAIGQGEQAE